jgi:hypothetical protein
MSHIVVNIHIQLDESIQTEDQAIGLVKNLAEYLKLSKDVKRYTLLDATFTDSQTNRKDSLTNESE